VAAGAGKAESKNKKKRKLDSSHLDTLTGDERMAVELYHAIKKSRKASIEGEDEEEEDEEKQMENTYNNSGDALVDAEEEKRAITYQIAKNKVCYILIRLRIRIGFGFNGVPGSGSGFAIRIRIQEGKNEMTKKEKRMSFIL
jgi:hypothetical protein